MKIGTIDLGPRPVLLAPMEDVTDIGFRLLCKRFGASMVYTEFVSAEALVRDVASTVRKLQISDEERPVGIQIYGRTVEAMVEAAKIVEQAGPDVIDLNFGCPVKKVAGKGAGAGMLQNIPLMLDITREVVKAVSVPVTVKTRLGWNHEQLIITDLAPRLQDCGIKALTIHGRTRSQMYTGEADWTLIGQVKADPRMEIPIIGNGDITSAEVAKDRFDRYGVDAIMVGRATFGCPWIFKEIGDALRPTRPTKPTSPTRPHPQPLPCEGRGEVTTAPEGKVTTAPDALMGNGNYSPPYREGPGEGLEGPGEGLEGLEGLLPGQKLDILEELLRINVERIDEQRGILHTRRHLAATPLFKGIPNFRPTRIAMLRATTLDELMQILESTREIISE